MNGARRAIKSVRRRSLFDKAYFQHHEAIAGKPLLQHVPYIKFVVAEQIKRSSSVSPVEHEKVNHVIIWYKTGE